MKTIRQLGLALLALLALLPLQPVSSQVYYGHALDVLYQLTVQNGTCSLNPIGNFLAPNGNPIIAADICLCPSGDMYITNNTEIYQVNPATGQAIALVATYNVGGFNFISGLVCGGNGLIYAATNSGLLYSLDPSVGTFNPLGNIGVGCSGDLVFYNNILYMSGTSGLVQVDLSNPSNSTLLFPGIGSNYLGLNVYDGDCNSLIGGGSSGTLFSINLATGEETQICNVGLTVGGLTSVSEFGNTPIPCPNELDLDGDDSSGAANFDFNSQSVTCLSPAASIADLDATISAGGIIGNMTITIASGILNPGEEVLQLPGGANLNVIGAGTATIVLQNTGGASLADFLNALKAIQYYNTADDLAPGIREIEVYFTTTNGQTSNTATAFVEVVGLPSATVDLGADQTICEGEAVIFDAGNPGAFYQWSNGESTQTISVTQAGDYSVTVTLGNACPNSDTAALLVTPLISPQLLGDNTVCEGSAVPITILFSGGSPTLNLELVSSAGEIFTLAGVSSGDQVTVFPMGNMVYSLAAQPNANPQVCLDLSGASLNIAAVAGESTATAVTVCEGDSIFLANAWQTQPGIYVDTYFDPNGCVGTLTTTLTLLDSDTLFQTFTTCDPAQVGLLVQPFTNANGCPSLAYTTFTLAPSPTLSINEITCDPSESGVFIENLVTWQGCDSIIITNIALVPPDTTLLSGTSCNPADVGVFTQTLSNADGCDSVVITTVTFLPADTTQLSGTSCDPADVGVFTQTLSNAEGCDSVVITTVTFLPADTTLLSNTSCDPADVGVFTQNLSNAEGCDSVVITTVTFLPADTTLISNTSCDPGDVGVFTQNLSNADGCDSVVITTVTFQLADTTLISNTSCDPGDVGVFTQNLSNADGCDSVVITTVTFLPADTTLLSGTSCDPGDVGVFTQNLSNADGCDSVVITTVTFQLADTTLISNTSCDPGDVGVFTQNLSNADGCDSVVITTVTFQLADTTLLSGTSCDPGDVGVFTQNLSNADGCDSVVITTVTFQLADTTLISNTSCDPGDVGVFTQNLSNADGCDSVVITTVTFLPADTTLLSGTSCDPADVGVFTQNLSNAEGCDSVVILSISYSAVDTTLIAATTCDPTGAGVFLQNFIAANGCDSLTITTVTLAASDTTYLLQTTCDPNAAGVFTQVLTNQNGCDSTVILTSDLLTVDTTWLSETTCAPSQAGVFTQILAAASGCDSVVVSTVQLLPSDLVAVVSSTCDPSQAGSFILPLTNQYGCDSMVQLVVSLLPSDTVWVQQETCDPAQVGTSIQVLQNQNGCDSIVVEVTSLSPPSVCAVEMTVGSTPVPCGETTGGSISITVNAGQPPFNYQIWQAGTVVATGPIGNLGQPTIVGGLPSGDFEVSVTSGSGLVAAELVVVAQTPSPQVSVVPTSSFGIFEISCQAAADGSAQAVGSSGTAPYGYFWSNGATQAQANGLAAGTYGVTLTDANGCTAAGAVVLTEPPTLEFSLSLNDPDCFSADAGLIAVEAGGGTSPYVFALNGGAFQTSNSFPNLPAGLYEVGVSDANGCDASEIAIINAPIPVSVSLGDDLFIELGQGTALEALVNVPFDSLASIVWSNLSDISCADCLEQQVFPIITTTYSVQVTGKNGCADDDEITVYVDQEKQVYVPNVFSPNDDGINDVFMIYPKPETAEKVQSFLVFSRWGETVHRFTDFLPGDLDAGWDGTHRGQPLNPAVFTWFAVIEFKDGKVELFKGDVLLVR